MTEAKQDKHAIADDKLELEEAAKLADSIAVGEYEEEIEQGGRRVRRRGVYMLPSMITLTALFAGFYAIVVAMQGEFIAAVLAIFVAAFCDGLDGRVARLTNTQSKFGAELDSLADMVSFGVAPALIMFSWVLQPLDRWGWAAAFIYVACAAMRLARFNTQIGEVSANTFNGLASPAAAGVMITTVWFFTDWGIHIGGENFAVAIPAAFLTALVGLMMVTNIAYNSFKAVNLRGRVPFVVMIGIVIFIALITIDPPIVLMTMAFVYAFSGPVMTVYKRVLPAKLTDAQN